MPRSTRVTHAVALLAGALGATALTVTGVASANHADHPGRPVPAPPTVPTRADQIQNIDQVKTAIKGYYGDTLDPATVNPVTGAKDLHTFSPTGNYAREVTRITDDAKRYLAHRHGHSGKDGRKAILLDVDDTSLNTYNYEIYSNFVYNPTTNAAFVNSASFPAVPSVPQLVNYAAAKGYTIFFLTGRPEAQRAGTATNLTKQGYPSVPADQLYLKDLTKPIYASCAPTCSTIQYKSLTRRYIESRGYDIAANFGDQYSDLSGGYSDRTYKLPNPMYYLP